MNIWYETEWQRDDGSVIDAWLEGYVVLAEPWRPNPDEPLMSGEVLDVELHERLEDGTWRELVPTAEELARLEAALYREAEERVQSWADEYDWH